MTKYIRWWINSFTCVCLHVKEEGRGLDETKIERMLNKQIWFYVHRETVGIEGMK